MHDLLIKNGLILDGSGSEAFRGSVAVKDGKISKIYGGDDSAEAAQIIDAGGKYITPGLIDIHRHGDVNVTGDTFGAVELSQGLTTIVNGQCGLSLTPCVEPHREEILSFLEPVIGKIDRSLPFALTSEYFDYLEKRDLALNVGMCIGNGTVRMASRGFEPGKRLSPDELRTAHKLLRDGLDAGALGVTMGIVYAPENCYDLQGFTEVLEPMKEYGVPLVTHIRGYGDLLHGSLREVISIAETLGVPLHISHMMAVGRQNWGEGLQTALGILDDARERGVQISCDVYPYTAGSSQLIQILPPWYQEGGVDMIIKRLSDPDMRRELVKILEKPSARFENLLYSTGFDSLLVTTVGSEKNQQFVGKTISQIAEMQNKDPYDCAFDLLIEEKCNVTMVIFITSESDILNIIKYPYSSIISDSVYPASGLPHPRLYGSYPKVLSEFVREKGLIGLPEAIRKMTSEPAKLYRIGNKGAIKEGYDADIAVFDLANIGCDASYVESRRLAYGMDKVLVGGAVAYDGGKIVNGKCGKLLRRKD